MNTYTRRTALLGLVTFMAAALPLSAQFEGEGSAMAPVEHAELGTLAAVLDRSDVIRTSLPGEDAQRTYLTNFRTEVAGLGSVMEPKDIPVDELGNIVVVTFVREGGQPRATELYFPDTETIRVTTGAIHSIDYAGKEVVLATDDGMFRTFYFGLGPGATIDSDDGLVELNDLRTGDELTVYYQSPTAAWSETDIAYLAYRLR